MISTDQGLKKMLKELISAIKGNSEEHIYHQIQKLIEKEPYNGHHYLRLADLLIKKGDTSKAIANYLKAARLFYKQGFSKKAMVAAKLVLRYDKDNEQALELLKKIEDEFKEEPVSETKEEVQQARQFSIFSQLNEDELQSLIKNSARRTFKKGEYIIMEGDVGDSLFLINKGAVKVITSIAGKSIELACLGPGDVVGEVALLTDRPRTASVIALEDTECFEIHRTALMEVIEKNPALADALNELYHERAKDTLSKVKGSFK